MIWHEDHEYVTSARKQDDLECLLPTPAVLHHAQHTLPSSEALGRHLTSQSLFFFI